VALDGIGAIGVNLWFSSIEINMEIKSQSQ
jgi:hypothetical protein